MVELFLSAPYLPFAIAFALMIGIGLIEAAGLGIGHFDLDGDGGSGWLDWLGLGDNLPILIWLTSLLCCFTLTGVAIQQVVTAVIGAPLHWGLAAGGALLIGGLLNGFAARGLMRIMPGYESTVISTDELLRLRGTVLEGTAARGAPARAKVVDQHGQAHFIMIEPHDDGSVIATGETALLVRREGKLFYAVTEADPLLRAL